MTNEPAPYSFGEIYRRAWKSSRGLWPLLLFEFAFALLRYLVFFTCALVLFGPLLEKYGKELAGSADSAQSFDWNPFFSDLTSLFSQPSWVAVGAGLLLLYVTWWCLLSALLDGGMFGSFWAQEDSGEPFSLQRFFQDAMRFFIPMIWLQAWLSLCLLVPFLGVSALVGVVAGLLALTGFNGTALWACAVLLGIPLVLLSVVFGVCFAVFGLAAKASVARGLQARPALREAFEACRSDRWRLTKGIGLVFLFYIGASFGLRMILGTLSLVPLVGPLFSLVSVLAGMALALLLGLYLPALTVAFFREGKLPR